MTQLAPGTCRYCGCTGEACTLADGEKCVWYDGERTCCNAPGCVRAEMARRAASAGQRSKYVGWGYGAIRLDLEKQRRKSKRRRRAA